MGFDSGILVWGGDGEHACLLDGNVDKAGDAGVDQ